MTERIILTTGPDNWAELGCWIDGHWGQYGPDRLIAIAIAEGWELEGDDAALAQMAYARLDCIGSRDDAPLATLIAAWVATHADMETAIDPEGEIISFICELSEEALEYLNSICPDGYLFHWHDGEMFLSPICNDPDNCTDETCAHWD